MTLAILDDLVAIVIIAMFYTSGLSVGSLVAAFTVLGIMFALRAFRVTDVAPYLVLGAIMWVCVLKSGVHATLAGVATAFLLPAVMHKDGHSNLHTIISDLHPWVAFAILPMFAFVNAGIDFSGMAIERLLTAVPLGVCLGLVVGKTVGVFGFSAITILLGGARLPAGGTWLQLFGISVLCGIGFTMSLFIGGLAFAESGVGYDRIDRLAVIVASAIAAVIGYAILRVAPSDPAAARTDEAEKSGSGH